MNGGLSTYKLPLTKSVIEQLNDRFISLDTETTGLSKNKDRLLEIGAVLFEKGKPVKRFQTFVNAGIAINPYAQAVNGISEKMIISAPNEKTSISMLLDFINEAVNGKTIVVGHNLKFDIGFLDEAMIRNGICAKVRYVDTLELSQSYLSLCNYKQTTVAEHFRISVDGSHRADVDSLICGQILVNILNLIRR